MYIIRETLIDYNFESLLCSLLLPFLFNGPSSAKSLNTNLTCISPFLLEIHLTSTLGKILTLLKSNASAFGGWTSWLHLF